MPTGAKSRRNWAWRLVSSAWLSVTGPVVMTSSWARRPCLRALKRPLPACGRPSPLRGRGWGVGLGVVRAVVGVGAGLVVLRGMGVLLWVGRGACGGTGPAARMIVGPRGCGSYLIEPVEEGDLCQSIVLL